MFYKISNRYYSELNGGVQKIRSRSNFQNISV